LKASINISFIIDLLLIAMFFNIVSGSSDGSDILPFAFLSFYRIVILKTKEDIAKINRQTRR